MKTMIRCLVMVLFVSTVSTQMMAQWELIGPFDQPWISAAAIQDSVIYTFTGQGLFKKILNGSPKWTKVQSYDDQYEIQHLAARDSILIASSHIDSLFILISTNSGTSWKKINVDTAIRLPHPLPITSIEIIGSTLFVGTSKGNSASDTVSGLFISTDIGTSWKNVNRSLLPSGIGKLKAVGSTIFSAGKGLYKSSDLGKDWQLVGLKDSMLNMIEVKDSTIITGRKEKDDWYFHTDGKLYLSLDRGKNWKTILLPDSIGPTAITIFENNLFIGSVRFDEYRILRSKDFGITWKDVTGNCRGYNVEFLHHNNVLSAVYENGGVFVSTDGESWQSDSKGICGPIVMYRGTAFDNSFFVSDYNGSNYVSHDGGQNWQSTYYGVGLPLLKIGSSLFAMSGSGLNTSQDTGRSWTVINADVTIGWAVLFDGSKIIASGSIKNSPSSWPIIASFDTGRTWSKYGTGSLSNEGFISFARIDSVIIAAAGQMGVYQSSDRGYSWWPWKKPLNPTTPYMRCVFTDGKRFLATGQDLIYSSNSMGINWVISARMPQYVHSIVQYKSNYICGCSNGKILRTYDADVSTWYEVEGKLPSSDIMDLAVVGDNLYAFIYGNGVWRRSLSEITGVPDRLYSVSEEFSLAQNYPNPFNPSTVISYQLPVNSLVSLKIYDLLGREIATLVNEEQSAGWKDVEWNASAFSSGIYFYKLQAGEFQETKRMILMK